MNVNVNLNKSQLIQGEAQTKSGAGHTTTKNKNLNIQGANLALNNENPLQAKREEGRKKAYDLVKQAWDSDASIDQSIEARNDRYHEMEAAKKEADEQLQSLRQQQEELLDSYDDTSDPEYIQRSLALSKQISKFDADSTHAADEMQDAVGDIHAIGIERLKSHGMVDAQGAAEDIVAAAAKEVVGLAMEDVKNTIDEQNQENKDQADEKKEEREEKQEHLEELAENRRLQEALVEGNQEAVEEAQRRQHENDSPELDVSDIIEQAVNKNTSQEVSQGLDDIKNSMKLLEADLKGIKVDEEV